MSRIGNKPILLPDLVKIQIEDSGQVNVQGPKGNLTWHLPEGVSASTHESKITLVRASDNRKVKALHGLSRSLIANMLTGVSTGFQVKLEIHGVGFRAAVNGGMITLLLGYSHPIEYKIPEGISITVAENTKLTIEGIDKQLVGQVAANLRAYYPPEPYKGKGVRYAGEIIERKQGKSVK